MGVGNPVVDDALTMDWTVDGFRKKDYCFGRNLRLRRPFLVVEEYQFNPASIRVHEYVS